MCFGVKVTEYENDSEVTVVLWSIWVCDQVGFTWDVAYIVYCILMFFFFITVFFPQ